jgi:hypothetical protein
VLVVGLGPLFSTAVAMVLWAKGVPNAKYFALGWLAGHITSTVDLLCIFGRIPYLSFMAYTIPLALISTLLFFTIALVEQTRAYKDHSGRDGLTGLANRRRFDEFLAMEWNRRQVSTPPGPHHGGRGFVQGLQRHLWTQGRR